jgi:REP element-mobilizing transposase RayT
MGRPLRIEGEHLCYHVYNRGNNKHTVFETDGDYLLFLHHLFNYAEKYDLEISAFCLMPNHFHLFLITHLANLGRFMQSFQTAFVKQYNFIHKRVGHVFQDRYKSLVVDTDAYGHELSRYIHLNPVCTEAVQLKPLQDQLQVLNSYHWSSYKAYCNTGRCPWSINTDMILSDFGTSRLEQIHKYIQYTNGGLCNDSDLFEHVYADTVLGSESFYKSLLSSSRISIGYDTSAQSARKKLTACSLPDVIRSVCKEYSADASDILISRPVKQYREARNMLLWIAATTCIGKVSIQEIGKRCGGITGSAVSKAIRRMDEKRKCNPMLYKRMQNILQDLNHKSLKSLTDPWMNMYCRLTAYHKRFGHCIVPINYSADTSLGAWVERQRLIRKGEALDTKPLTKTQIALLDKLGFSWRMQQKSQ